MLFALMAGAVLIVTSFGAGAAGIGRGGGSDRAGGGEMHDPTGNVPNPNQAAQPGAAPAAGSSDSGTSNRSATPQFSDMDTNKDGVVSREEYIIYYTTLYDRADTGRKGVLNRDQMRGIVP